MLHTRTSSVPTMIKMVIIPCLSTLKLGPKSRGIEAVSVHLNTV